MWKLVVARGKNCIENVGEESVETNYPIIPIWGSVALHIGKSVNIKTNKAKLKKRKAIILKTLYPVVL